MHGPVFNLCYFLQMFSDLLMSQVSMPRLGPKTSTRVPPLETLSSEVALGASPFSRQMISIGSPSPQVLSMFSLNINDVILFHLSRNIYFMFFKSTKQESVSWSVSYWQW